MLNESEKNAETVRRGYAAFNAGDMKTLTEIFDENVSWHAPGKNNLAGKYHGRDKAFALFGRYHAETKGTIKAALKHILTGPDGRVVGVHHNTGERNGKRLDTECCILFELKNGRCIAGKEYYFDQYTWDAFWS